MSNSWLQNIYNKFARTIFRTSYSFTKNTQIAEDITQETFVELHFMGINRFENDDKVRAWLRKTATNKSLNYIKREKKFINMPPEVIEAIETPYQETNPENQLSQKEFIQETKKAIQSLPDDYQGVIMLYYYAELSYNEISELLSIPIGTVKSRLNRGRLLIKKSITELEQVLEEGVYNHERS